MQKYFKPYFKGILFILLAPFLGCSGNLLSEMAKKETDTAVLFEVNHYLNSRQYTEAIAQFEKLSAESQSQRENQFLLASAYAGRCGLDFLDLAKGLKDLSGGELFKMIMNLYPTANAQHLQDCQSAEDKIRALGTTAQRTDDENLFLLFVELSKMGTLLNMSYDSNHDGAPDAASLCSKSIFSDAQAAEFGASLGIIVEIINQSSLSVLGSTASQLTSACADSPADLICGKTSASQFSASESAAVRTVVEAKYTTGTTAWVGLGVCASDFQTCRCSP